MGTTSFCRIIHTFLNGGNMKYLESMANALQVEYNTFIEVSKKIGILNANGFPRKKYIDEGYFDSDGNIADYQALKWLYSEKLKNFLG